ncbi:MAG: DMT family transporter [Oscillospiraceae bacterium]|nr:DMT family transporter [Oscillospiraceae bacterium]
MTKNKAILEILLCSGLWSIAGVFMKLIPWSGFAIAGARGVLAAGVMAVFMAVRGLRVTLTKRSVFGGICLCGTMTLFAVANKTTTAANAIVLQFTSPIWIMLISGLLFHTRFRRADVLAVGLTLLGVALCFSDGLVAGSLWGNLIAIGSGLCLACYYISLGDSPEDARMTGVLIAHLLTVVIGLPVLIATRPPVTAAALGAVAVLGIFQLGIPYVLLAHASGWVSPLVMSLLSALEPLLNPLWVAIFDGEMPGFTAVIGALLVVVTVTAWCIYHGKREEAAA